MNGGTCTTKPVSSRSGLSCALAVAPLMAGVVSATARSTVSGSKIPTGAPLEQIHRNDGVGQQVLDGVTKRIAGQANLFKALGVHKMVRIAVHVQKLHPTGVQRGALNVILRAELLVGQRAAPDVAKTTLHEPPLIARCQVVEVENPEQILIPP